MIWQTVVCFLAACGLVMVVWTALGIPALGVRRGNTALLWRTAGDCRALRRQRRAWVWLRESGLGPGRLVLWDEGLSEDARRLAEQWARNDPRITLTPPGEGAPHR